MLIGGATQVSSEEAISNLASWWRLLPLTDNTPLWLTSQMDTYVLVGILIGLLAMLVIPRVYNRAHPPLAPITEQDKRLNEANEIANRKSGLASIEQALALSDITEVGTWTPILSYVEKDGDTVLDLVKADGRYKSLERYLEIDCRLEFILPNLPDSTKISITGLPFTINSDIHGIPIECKSRDTPNRTATFSGHVYGGSAQVRFHVTPHDLISGEVCYLQFKIVHINSDLSDASVNTSVLKGK